MKNKILVIGLGSIGFRHVQNLLKITNSEIIICTKRTDRGILQKKNTINDVKRITIVKKLEDAINLKPNLGIICNETSLHIETALALAKNGIDIFIEKPLSNSKKDLEKLRRISNDKKIIIQIGNNFRFHPVFREIRKILKRKFLGKIITVQIESNSYLPDWHKYEDYRSGYAANDKLGGGITLTAIHEIDLLYWFFGQPKEITSMIGKFSNLDVKTDDVSSSIIKFKSNFLCELHLDFIQKPYYKKIEIHGEKRTLFWDTQKNEIKIFNFKNSSWKTKKVNNNYKINSVRENNIMYVDEMRFFLKQIRKRERKLNNLDDGIMTLKIALAIKKSSKTKKTVLFS